MAEEETRGETPVVHSSPVVEEATDANGVDGGVTSDGAFVPGDAEVAVAPEADEATDEGEEEETE
jgi:hypothetical protein